ncbi:MAG TPA: ATP-binding protein [Bdellovibrionota bacterium]|nr:ATP-binding protein [Bdellovibrionota bacterium]
MGAPGSFKSPLSHLAKGITDSAFVLDLQRNILEFNRGFLKIHSVDAREMRTLPGSFCRTFVNMEICENDCILKKCLESGTPVRFDEVRGKTRAGELLNLIVTAVPIRDEKGDVVAVLEMHRDVTDEAQIHSKYKVLLDKEKRAKEELERLVEIRTNELKHTQAQLVHSEKMSALGQMVAGIAHELNNPINFISGNLDSMEEYSGQLRNSVEAIRKIVSDSPPLKQRFEETLKKHDIDFLLEDMAKLIRSIRTGSDRAADLVQGLKTFSRLDEAEFKETDLHGDLDMALTLLRHEFKDRVEIHRDYGAIPKIRCMANQLNQVFINILHNAIQAIEKNGDIWIRTSVEGENVRIEIEDNGIGIPPENLKKIFDPFFTTKDVGKGTGLGLSISYGIVERHGGVIEVGSTLKKGTTFRVILPIAPPHSPEASF